MLTSQAAAFTQRMVNVSTYRMSKTSAATKKPNGIGSSTSNIADVMLDRGAGIAEFMPLLLRRPDSLEG
ncbi:hypothetical protein ACEN9H_15895 [Massilia cellulosiltytica]|uniref:hypothetical protein n=1 Tax=Massilia cellulosiltytica TaxID=2683234 RepID=UPI0039B6B695